MTRGRGPLTSNCLGSEQYMSPSRPILAYVTSDESFNLTEPELPIFLRIYITLTYPTTTSQGAVRSPEMVHIKFSLRSSLDQYSELRCCVTVLEYLTGHYGEWDYSMWAYISYTWRQAARYGCGEWGDGFLTHEKPMHLALSSPLLLSRFFMYEVTESLYTKIVTHGACSAKTRICQGLYRRNKSMKWMLRLYVCVGGDVRVRGERERYRSRNA